MNLNRKGRRVSRIAPLPEASGGGIDSDSKSGTEEGADPKEAVEADLFRCLKDEGGPNRPGNSAMLVNTGAPRKLGERKHTDIG